MSLPGVHFVSLGHPSAWKKEDSPNIAHSRESLGRLGSWETPRLRACHDVRLRGRRGPARGIGESPLSCELSADRPPRPRCALQAPT
jgi:hypothetical protein